MSLIDDIKAVAKEDADLSGIESQIGGYINSNDVTTDNFIEIAKKHPKLLSAFDSQVSKRVESGVNNFKEKDMVSLLKSREEEIRAEINPKETPEQKKVRELTDKITAMESKEKLSMLQSELSLKAKELGFDTIKAKDYAIYGDRAMDRLEADAEWFKSELETRLSSEIKEKYSKTVPKSRVLDPADIDTKIKEARASGNAGLALRLQMQKEASQT
jgi:hypothetical protein